MRTPVHSVTRTADALSVRVELPDVKKASEVDLEISMMRLKLIVPDRHVPVPRCSIIFCTPRYILKTEPPCHVLFNSARHRHSIKQNRSLEACEPLFYKSLQATILLSAARFIIYLFILLRNAQ